MVSIKVLALISAPGISVANDIGLWLGYISQSASDVSGQSYDKHFLHIYHITNRRWLRQKTSNSVLTSHTVYETKSRKLPNSIPEKLHLTGWHILSFSALTLVGWHERHLACNVTYHRYWYIGIVEYITGYIYYIYCNFELCNLCSLRLIPP